MIGTRMAAEPVFDDTSVNSTIIAIDTTSITHSGAVLIELNIEEAIQAVVPVVPSTEERHKP